VTRSALDPLLAIEPCGQTCLGCKGRDAPWPGETTMSDKQAILDAARATLERTEEAIMAWTTPTLVEICIGLEINGYLPAEFLGS
jgi:coenzyme PQQ precursor peptide PqqA